MPESQKPPELPEDFQKKMEELQKAEDNAFMKDYSDVSIDDLISRGFVIHTIEITKGFTVKMRTLKKKEELEVKQRLSTYDGAQMYVVDQINTDTLAFAAMEINGVPLPTAEQKNKEGKSLTVFEARKEIITELGDVLCLAMIEEYRSLNKALVILVKGSSKNSLARLLLGQERA